MVNKMVDSAKFEQFVIERDENDRIIVRYSNTKDSLRKISEKVGFGFDDNWNTQMLGRKLINFLNEGSISPNLVQLNEVNNESEDEEDEMLSPIADEDWQWWCGLSDTLKYILLSNIKWDIEEVFGEFRLEDDELIADFDFNDRECFGETVAEYFTGYSDDPDKMGALVGIEVPDNAFETSDIGKFSRLNQLERFSLYYYGLEGELMDSISELTQIKELSLNRNELDENCLLPLASLTNLEELDLGNNSFSSHNTDAYATLAKLSNLRKLNMYFSGELPAELFSYLSQLSYLEELTLTGSTFTSENLENYSALAKLSNLKTLEIDYCEGLPIGILGYICQLANLERLLINYEDMSNSQQLSKLLNLKELEIHTDYSSSFNDSCEEFKALKEQLPNCSISIS